MIKKYYSLVATLLLFVWTIEQVAFAQQQLQELTVNADECLPGMVLNEGLCEEVESGAPIPNPSSYVITFEYPGGTSASSYNPTLSPELHANPFPAIVALLLAAKLITAATAEWLGATLIAMTVQAVLYGQAISTYAGWTFTLALTNPSFAGVQSFSLRIAFGSNTLTVISQNHPLYNTLLPLISRAVQMTLGGGGGGGEIY